VTRVVAALIENGDRFLICQRPVNKARGLLWEFAGGKIETGETPQQALLRECREELGIEVTVCEQFAEVIHAYPDLTVQLTVFRARMKQGEPQRLEHEEIRWITAEEIDAFDFCPADDEILNHIKEEKAMKEVYEFLKKCGTYYLATCDNGQARVRPFGTIDLYEGKLTIQTGKSKDVARQMFADPKVELCAFDGEQWLRVAAEAAELPEIAAQEHMLEAYPDLKAMYTPGDGNTCVFALQNATATFASFTAAPRTVKF